MHYIIYYIDFLIFITIHEIFFNYDSELCDVVEPQATKIIAD